MRIARILQKQASKREEEEEEEEETRRRNEREEKRRAVGRADERRWRVVLCLQLV